MPVISSNAMRSKHPLPRGAERRGRGGRKGRRVFDFEWSPAEKKIARAAHEAARDAAIAKIVAEFKRRAITVASASVMWEVEAWLREQREQMDGMFGYRYLQPP